MLAELAGVSKRSVQPAIDHLKQRRLIKARPTSEPSYSVLTPWIHKKL